MNDTGIEQLLRENAQLQRKVSFLRIACTVVLSVGFLIGVTLQGRELYEARQQLEGAQRHISLHWGTCYRVSDMAQMKRELREAQEKLAYLKADHQKTLRAYDAAYRAEHGVTQSDPQSSLIRRSSRSYSLPATD